MTVYIDDMYRQSIGEFRGMRMSHMIADDDDERHMMAAHIGMKREWFQGDHYDAPSKAAAGRRTGPWPGVPRGAVIESAYSTDLVDNGRKACL